MIKNKYKKVVSAMLLLTMTTTTLSVDVFAGGDSSCVKVNNVNCKDIFKCCCNNCDNDDHKKEDTPLVEHTTTFYVDVFADGSTSQISKTDAHYINTSGTVNAEPKNNKLYDNDCEPPKYEGDCGENARYLFNEETGKLIISGKGEMKNYSDLKVAPWYRYRDKIKSIEIKAGLTSVGDYAFDGCKNLTEVHTCEAEESLNYIGKNAFRGFSEELTIIYIWNERIVHKTMEIVREDKGGYYSKPSDDDLDEFVKHTGLTRNILCRVERFVGGYSTSDSDDFIFCESNNDNKDAQYSCESDFESDDSESKNRLEVSIKSKSESIVGIPWNDKSDSEYKSYSSDDSESESRLEVSLKSKSESIVGIPCNDKSDSEHKSYSSDDSESESRLEVSLKSKSESSIGIPWNDKSDFEYKSYSSTD